MNRLSSKQAHFLGFIANYDGFPAAADIHRAIGRDYAHGHHKFSYETLHRLQARGLIKPSGTRTATGGYGLALTPASIALVSGV